MRITVLKFLSSFKKYVPKILLLSLCFFLYVIVSFSFYLVEFKGNQDKTLQNMGHKISSKIDASIILSQKLVKKSSGWNNQNKVMQDISDVVPKNDPSILSIEWTDFLGNTVNRFGRVNEKINNQKKQEDKVDVELLSSGNIYISSVSIKAEKIIGYIVFMIDSKELLSEITDLNNSQFISYSLESQNNKIENSMIYEILLKDVLTQTQPVKNHKLQIICRTNKSDVFFDYLYKRIYELACLYVAILLLTLSFIRLREREMIAQNGHVPKEEFLMITEQVEIWSKKYLECQRGGKWKAQLSNQIYARVYIGLLQKAEEPSEGLNNIDLRDNFIGSLFILKQIVESIPSNVNEINLIDDLTKSMAILSSEGNDFKLILDSQSDIQLVKTDELLLKMVLLNMLRVSTRDLPQDGIIRVCISSDDAYVNVSVKTNGFGYEQTINSSKKYEDITVLDKERLQVICQKLGISINIDSKQYEGVSMCLAIPKYLKDLDHLSQSRLAANVYTFPKK